MWYHSIGDTLGYHNGHWEFNNGVINVTPEYTNELIYEFISLGGINGLRMINWRASDDTILYMATAAAFVLTKHKTVDDLGNLFRHHYIKAIPQLESRDPGSTTMNSLRMMESGLAWNKLPYNPMSIGAGAAMRTGFIGLYYAGKLNRNKLIAVSIEASRITHNSTIGFLGGMVSALFTAYALERVPINVWPHKLLNLLKGDRVDKYLQKSRPDEYKFYERDKHVFIGKWQKYIDFRFSGLQPRTDIKSMKNPVTRIKYLADNYSRTEKTFFPGSCGDDSVIIAYDSLLESGPNEEKMVVYSILHPGDSDTVGCIGMSWFATYYSTTIKLTLVENNIDYLEFKDYLTQIGMKFIDQKGVDVINSLFYKGGSKRKR
jgi:ADP-ribosylarginine hydrolase